MNIEEYKKVTEDLKRRKIPAEVKCAVLAMLEKKAEEIVVLKLKGVNDITDYMILCTAASPRQNNAICDGVQEMLRKEHRRKAYSVEGEHGSDWILVDYIDFIVHIFKADSRRNYGLEKLWMDAKRYDFYISTGEQSQG